MFVDQRCSKRIVALQAQSAVGVPNLEVKASLLSKEVFDQENFTRRYLKACLPRRSFRSRDISNGRKYEENGKRFSEFNDSKRKSKEGQKSSLKRQSEALQSEAEKTVGRRSDSMPKGKEGPNTRLKRQSGALQPEALQPEAEKSPDFPSDISDTAPSESEDEDINFCYPSEKERRFDNFCIALHLMVQDHMDIDLEEFLPTLESETSTYQENVWRDGPEHAHLAGLLKLLNFSPSEWTCSLSRLNRGSMALDLNEEQSELLNRFDAGALLSSVLGGRPGQPKSKESSGELEVKGPTEGMDSDSWKGRDLKQKSVASQ